MVKSVEQINLEFMNQLQTPQSQGGSQSGHGKRTKAVICLKLILDVAFYTAIAFVLISTVALQGKSGAGFDMFGYSGFVVLSDSMKSEIPRGALVITKRTEPDRIRTGDDITYIRSDNATVTHRVVGIDESYKGSETRAFITKGIENADVDAEVVFAPNVIGVVQLSIPELGFALGYIAENIGVVFLLLGGIATAVVLVRKFIAGKFL